MIRKPVVSGVFYSKYSDDLKEDIERCFKHDLGPGELPNGDSSKDNIIGLVTPHAGYMYSGHVAAHSYYELISNGIPKTVIILSPNHTGLGSPISIMGDGVWSTPLGDVEIDSDFTTELLKRTDVLVDDASAHLKEHSIEVHLPFLQYFSNDFKIVPIVMWMQDLDSSKELSEAIYDTIVSLNKSVVIIASTDLTHYMPRDIAKSQDDLVIEAILNLDEEAMINRIEEHNITMCGYGPVATMILVSKKLGVETGKLLKYSNSGDISGDHDSVVGYASIVLKK